MVAACSNLILTRRSTELDFGHHKACVITSRNVCFSLGVSFERQAHGGAFLKLLSPVEIMSRISLRVQGRLGLPCTSLTEWSLAFLAPLCADFPGHDGDHVPHVRCQTSSCSKMYLE